jgi:hypothetical protein
MTASNKYNIGGKNIFDSAPIFDNIFIGKVVSIADEFDGGRIKVRIKGIDDKLNDNDLIYAFPLLPKFINILPEVGESVFVFLLKDDNKYDNRMWLGPIISQPQKLKFDPHFHTSTSLLSTGIISPERAPSTLPEAKGVYPDKRNVAIQGRDNTDIILKPKEIVLRAGKFDVGNNLKFNKKNLGYIQIKHNVTIDSENDTKGSVTNIVSNKINLLSHDGNPRFILNDQENLISSTELEKILTKTQPLVYGNVLLEFIKLFINYAVNHNHAYHGLPPVKDSNVDDLLKFDLNRLLSENIRIN